jgi:FtsP/CotA-like multicopper oxidase with cupredoxin domain
MLKHTSTSRMLGIVLGSLVSAAPTSARYDGGARAALPIVQANPNTESAGLLRNGVLTATLEAKPSTWYLDGPRHPAMTIEAFAEPGKPSLMPGPLVRVPAGTELRLTIRNSLARPLTFFLPREIRGTGNDGDAIDSLVVMPGSVGTLASRAIVPGSYVYRATTPLKSGRPQKDPNGLLAGAIVVDTARAVGPPHDRIFVMMATWDSAEAACIDTVSGDNAVQSVIACGGERRHYTINGASWPRTERLHATVGDTLHWRVIDAAGGLPHPMHLHGFYYRVDSYQSPSTRRGDVGSPPIVPGQMVVTQFLPPGSAMSITWSPNRPGNWLFHCHTAMHTTAPDTLSDEDMHGMAGLVLGTIVTPRAGVAAAAHPGATVRRLRLVAEQGAGAKGHRLWGIAVRDSVPLMHFVLEEQGRVTNTHTDFSPELDLVRGEPVAITIVNHLDEATSVHWHGIELEDSYMDGAAGFGGTGTHLTPAIAPNDSFVARFTPPRAGTFMYHAHVDDVREQLAGLEGALIVRDRGASSADDHVFFLKGFPASTRHPLEIDGQANPDTIVLHAGRAERLRFINLTLNMPQPSFFLTARRDSISQIARDTMLVRWRLMAKDGFDLPSEAQSLRPADQIVGMGETWDVEFTPERRGTLNLEIRESGGRQLLRVRVPFRVE